MLLLALLLLVVLLPDGNNEDGFQGPTFYLIQTSSFANSTWAQNQGSGWLDDLQIHGWDSDSGTAIFLKPWSKGNFSDEEMIELEELFRVYLIGFIREVQDRASDFQMEYPFEIQGIAGCELLSGENTVSFLRGALGGLDFLSVKNYSCAPAPEGGSRAERFCALVSQYQGILDTIEKLLYKSCPRFLLSVLNAGKADLQRQDGTWYLRATLDVVAGRAAGLSCRVKHSSLGGQDIILYWGHPISIGLICLAIIVPSLILSIGLALWFMRRWSYQNIQ
ncbi:T-cell surface glycoprotein CD1b-1 isoform X2 [Trichechus manatus latirostris]|uniref:T-cell surface glycoprotein CD1b-1 isoform X2 n=1 Tax=Trichechus manatus latirostris TaxID=127582 RepID=A0A2Y9QIE3_TRIMA|nr:T-cell surface glycoprotein CD1b-1 isoform X2 [Trichechus manatus latirostris]